MELKRMSIAVAVLVQVASMDKNALVVPTVKAVSVREQPAPPHLNGDLKTIA